MAKMCKHYNCLDGMGGKTKCPKNTNDDCQIIPRREKMVRVKAWGYFCTITGRLNAMDKLGERKMKDYFPVTILIDEKYLKEKP